jgi:hypothetical protein
MMELVRVYLVDNNLIHRKGFQVEVDVIMADLFCYLIELMKLMDELIFLQ